MAWHIIAQGPPTLNSWHCVSSTRMSKSDSDVSQRRQCQACDRRAPALAMAEHSNATTWYAWTFPKLIGCSSTPLSDTQTFPTGRKQMHRCRTTTQGNVMEWSCNAWTYSLDSAFGTSTRHGGETSLSTCHCKQPERCAAQRPQPQPLTDSALDTGSGVDLLRR